MPMRTIDPELAPILAADALEGLDELLATQPPGESMQYRKIGALVRVINLVGSFYRNTNDDDRLAA